MFNGVQVFSARVQRLPGGDAVKPEPLHPAPFAHAEPRHPRCIRATPVAGVPATLADQQAERILDLEGKLARSRGENHDLRNRVTAAEGALELIAMHIGMAADAAPCDVLAEVMRRIR